MIPTQVLPLQLPKTSVLNHKAAFGTVDETTANTLGKIAEARQNIIIASDRAYSDSAIRGVGQYLPSLFGLMDKIKEFKPENTKKLKIMWSSTLSERNKDKQLSCTDWNYEVTQVLMLYALLHRKCAAEKLSVLSNETFAEGSKEVCKYLQTAAGVFRYVRDEIISEWAVDPKQLKIPEAFGDSFLILENICTFESQQVIIRKACMSKAKPIILATLSAENYKLMRESLDLWQTIVKNDVIKDEKFMVPNIELYLRLMCDYCHALTNFFTAEHNKDIGKPGVAVGYFKQAMAILNNNTVLHPAPSGYFSSPPQLDEFMKSVKYDVESHVLQIQAKSKECEVDNKVIYHEEVITKGLTLTEGKLIAKPILFEPPEAAVIDITQTSDSWCSVM